MNDLLKKCRKKRNLSKNSEAKIESIENNNNKFLRFVVQHHDASSDHYDFRLEWKGVLLSWAIPKGPSFNPSDKRLAIQGENHPFKYRNFEGTIPEDQYGGGTVMIWDQGFWESSKDTSKALDKGEHKFELKGERLKGSWTLVKWEEKSDEEQENWLLIKEKDGYAKKDDGISTFKRSVRTGRTMSEIEKERE